MITFPLSATDWFGLLPIAAMALDPVEQTVDDLNGRGEWLTDDVAPMLWQGEVTLGRMLEAEAAHAAVMMDLIRPSGALFWAYDIRRPFPKADPTGSILGGASPVVYALPAGSREIRLSGLPAGYELRRGDYLGWTYDSGRWALHRVASSQVVASGTGITPAFDLNSVIRPGVTVGTAVQLIRPALPMMRIRGSISPGQTRAAITEGFTFRFSQTLQRIT